MSYDDLLKDKALMRVMKEALLGFSEQDLNEEEDKKSDWNGKTIFELLRNQNSAESSEPTMTSTSTDATSQFAVGDVIVGRCLLEHSSDVASTLLQVGSSGKDESAKNPNGEISSILQDGSTSSLRAMERGESGEEEQILNTFIADGVVVVRDKTEKEDETNVESQGPPSQAGGDRQTGIATTTTTTTTTRAESGGLGSKSVSIGGEARWGTSLSFALSFIHHPAILAACYCLACLHQLTGLDFVTSLGILMAMISMVAMFFF